MIHTQSLRLVMLQKLNHYSARMCQFSYPRDSRRKKIFKIYLKLFFLYVFYRLLLLMETRVGKKYPIL
ncbi:hypothetical protein CP335_08005 [Pseudomonas fluorescens]|uniref:Uncharacterized protein n=1 Tax=Pseudomonas fluorescens TaxID=294 RepID=A0A854X3K9_PSEFL|nr:hypothetical protein CP335_08005 [Pseudomonas fluorescens]